MADLQVAGVLSNMLQDMLVAGIQPRAQGNALGYDCVRQQAAIGHQFDKAAA